jgi:hypothetical protein
MRLSVQSVSTKLTLLGATITIVVGSVSLAYDYLSSQRLMRQEMLKRGRYIVGNLAYNSKYGVLTEDKPLLAQFLEGALSGGGREGSDVVAAMIRDQKGVILAQKGPPLADLPPTPAATFEDRETTTAAGEPVMLFRAPVTTDVAAAGGDMAAELGVAAAPSGPALKGGVEVAIS